ncbi:MAG: PilW family protein [Gallionella sp.]|nr:PilW family protein [Gallionella sp.]
MKNHTVKYINSPAPSAFAGMGSLQRGLSLVELMISITIGLLILAALSTLFVNQSKTRAELDKSNRMIDNGRYALEVLSDNLRLAGYYGEFSPTATIPGAPGALPDPCTTTAADISAALLLAVQGYEATAQTSQITSLPCGFTYTAGNGLSLKPGSDILAMRRASTATPIVAGAAIANTHYLQVSRCQYDAVPYKLSTTPADFTLRKSSNCTPASGAPYADLRNFLVQVYFVAPSNNATVVVPGSGCAVGDCIPTLKRYEIDQSNPSTNQFVVTPLVEGVEYMQVDYGLDAGTDGVPDSFITAPVLADWPNIVAVRINILARNNEPTSGYKDTKTYSLGIAGTFGPFNDSYKRHVYTQFVRLTNPAGRRDPL